ncbi:MAG: YitT family protein [Lachnospiraceae bacterium]|nr:YitT family protein [Lachnospiraceae bacterium]
MAHKPLSARQKKVIWKEVKTTVMIVLAALILAFNVKSLVRARDLFPGGITGVTVLIQGICEKYWSFVPPYTLVNLTLNAIPVYIGFRYIGKRFTFYSVLLIVLSSVLTDAMPSIPITYDILLISIFGGMLSGLATSICLSEEATSGGLDFVSIFLSEKYGIDAWNYILMVNAVILLVAGYMFGWAQALYSIIFQFTSTQVIHVSYKRYHKNTLLIITDKASEIAFVIDACTKHSSTIFSGIGTYESKPRNMVYSVVASDEVKRVVREIHRTDPNAFINVLKTEQLAGKFYLKPTR